MSIETALTALQGDITAARAAVTAKGGTATSGGGSSQLAGDIWTIPTERVSAVSKDINFYDYDGTIVASWTLDELASKTELPPNPTHAGLVPEGWNWTLQEIKDWGYPCEVGQLYNTADGKVHFFIEIDDLDVACFSLYALSYSAVDIDWGDGTVERVPSSYYTYFTHQYTQLGKFEIKMESSGSNISYSRFARDAPHIMRELWQSRNMDTFPLSGRSKLQKWAVSNSLFFHTNQDAYYPSLVHMALPRTITSVGVSNTMQGLSGLVSLSTPPGFKGTAGTNSFTGFYGLRRLTAAGMAGEFTGGLNTAFIERFIVPAAVTAIKSAIFQNSILCYVRFLPTTPPTKSTSTSFAGLASTAIIFIPWDSPAYLTATNYPSPVTYLYLGFVRPSTAGAALPTQTTDGAYSLTWYATSADARAETNPITVGNGKEVYCRYTEATT